MNNKVNRETSTEKRVEKLKHVNNVLGWTAVTFRAFFDKL